MLQLKKLKKPSKRSGIRLAPGELSEWKKFGVKILNVGSKPIFVDSVTPKPKKKKKK